MVDQNSPDRLLESYRDDVWLSINRCDKALCLDYFSRSPFFIPGSKLDHDNSMESSPSSQISYSLRPVTEAEDKVGVYVIQRIENGILCGLYCIINGTIIQSPPLSTLVISRCGRAGAHLASALRTLRELEEVEGLIK